MDTEPKDDEVQEATFVNAPKLEGVEVQAAQSPREILDPNGTLPEVEFEVYSKHESEDLSKTNVRIKSGGSIIGRCTLQQYRGSIHFDGIELDDLIDGKQRGKGYGLATYVKAIEFAHERGLPFETQSSWNQTEDAKRIWLILRDAGVATEIEPFQPDEASPYPNRYKGRYRVEY